MVGLTSKGLSGTPREVSVDSSTATLLAREKWIAACRFYPLGASEVLQTVFQKAATYSRPVVLLDLDSTLYEVRPRTYRILCEWAATQMDTLVQDIILTLREEQVQYSIRDTLLYLQEKFDFRYCNHVHQSLESFWMERFFTHEYLVYDRPYAGAVEFVKWLYSLGVEIIYLTGRDEPNMGDGTRRNFLRDGFPWGLPRTHLLMKSAFKDPDLAHKQGAADFIFSKGSLVASFENEPLNLVALQDIFPEAMHVFVDTICSETPARPKQGLYRISEFVAP